MDNKDEEEGLVISTVHSAKGLEWEYVFVLDCVTGVYPGFNAMSMAEEERQENLRVFYVAITRAKNKCTYVSQKYIMNVKYILLHI